MERKEDTPVRKTRRKYEEKNKEKRKQASGNFGTMIPRALYEKRRQIVSRLFLPFCVNKSLARRLYLRKTRLKL